MTWEDLSTRDRDLYQRESKSDLGEEVGYDTDAYEDERVVEADVEVGSSGRDVRLGAWIKTKRFARAGSM
jgi:hypothetical protein